MAIDAATVRKVARLARIAEPEEKLEQLASERVGLVVQIRRWGGCVLGHRISRALRERL